MQQNQVETKWKVKLKKKKKVFFFEKIKNFFCFKNKVYKATIEIQTEYRKAGMSFTSVGYPVLNVNKFNISINCLN